MCLYSDGDDEDLSMADLKRLQDLSERKHNVSIARETKTTNETIHTSGGHDSSVVATFLANITQPKQNKHSTLNTNVDAVGIGTADDIDTGKVQIWSCENAEKRGNTCLQSVCNKCYLKKEEAPSTRGKRDTTRPKKSAKVVCGKSCNLDHSKQITFKHADLQYIVGKFADEKRKLKVDNQLPLHCAECKGKFV